MRDVLRPLGGIPLFVEAADLDLDGDQDLAVLNVLGGTLQTLRNDGQGTFAAPATYAGDVLRTRFDLGDFNGDFLPDAVIGSKQGRVSVLINIGNAAFAAPFVLPIGGSGTAYGQEVHAVAALDVEHDGDVDIVAAARDYLAVFLGDGHGSFANPTLYSCASAPGFPEVLAVGDFDDDGYEDVLRPGVLSVDLQCFVNDTTGGFRPPTMFTLPSPALAMLLCDVNGDAHGDLVYQSSSLRVQLGDGHGNFGTPSDTVVYFDGKVAGAQPIRPVDFDGDGVLDLLASSRGLRWLRGLGNGTFVAQSYVLCAPGALALISGDCADFDGDGQLDMAGVSTQTLRVALADCDGGYASHSRFPTGLVSNYTEGTAIDIGDLDGDGELDAVCGLHDGSAQVSVLLGDGRGSFAAASQVPVGTSMNALALGDLTGDGVLDLVLTNNSVGSIDVFAGNGAGGFTAFQSVSSNTHLVDVAVAELDGHPGLDVVVADRLTPRIAVYPNTGAGVLGAMIPISLTGVRRPTCLAVGQVDGLAGADIVVGYVHNQTNGPRGIAVLLGDGVGGFTLQVNDFASSIYDLALADLDGDGNVDVVATDEDFGVRALRHFTGGAWSVFTGVALGDVGSIALGDIDGDGHADAAVSTQQGGMLAVLLGDSAGNLRPPIFHARDFQTYEGSGLVIADFDHDLRGDVAACNGNSCTLSLFTHQSAAGQAVAYCAARTNSLGCVPQIGGSGVPSATSVSSFDVNAGNVLNQKSGFLMYGLAAADNPLSGGLKCIDGPTRRTAVQSSGGSTSGSDCSGRFTFDFNAYVQSGIDPRLAPGTEVFAQYWSRDPLAAGKLNVTDGLRFTLCP